MMSDIEPQQEDQVIAVEGGELDEPEPQINEGGEELIEENGEEFVENGGEQEQYHDEGLEEEEYYEEVHHVVYAPSEHLLMTTNNRKNDINELIKRKEQMNVPPSKIKTNFTAPSEHLTRTTQARISDIREREHRKEELLEKKDIWWDERKPVPTVTRKQKVESKLFQPTSAYLHQQRSKVPPTEVPDKGSIPKSSAVPAARVSKLERTSPLLRPTRNSICQAYGAKPPPPPSPHLQLSGMLTGPQNVQSKLLVEGQSAKYKKYKSKEDLLRETKMAQQEISPCKLKVKTPSERLLTPNTAMRQHSRTKAVKKEPTNEREAGWDVYFIKEKVISDDKREELMPLPKINYVRDSWEGNVDVDESQYLEVDHHFGVDNSKDNNEVGDDNNNSGGAAALNGSSSSNNESNGHVVADDADADVAGVTNGAAAISVEPNGTEA